MGLLGMICLIVRILVWRRTARTLRTGGSLGLLLPSPLVEEGDWWLFADVFFFVAGWHRSVVLQCWSREKSPCWSIFWSLSVGFSFLSLASISRCRGVYDAPWILYWVQPVVCGRVNVFTSSAC